MIIYVDIHLYPFSATPAFQEWRPKGQPSPGGQTLADADSRPWGGPPWPLGWIVVDDGLDLSKTGW